jgi:hypothetical protein
MKSVITKLAPVTEDMTWTTTPYALEIKGEAEPRVTVKEVLNPDTGRKMVRIIALATAGVPVQPLPTLDQIARRILPDARVQAFNKSEAGNRIVREYATA